MKRVLLLFIAFLVLLSFPASAETGNKVLNPGFEERDGLDPYFWTTGSWEDNGKFSLDPEQAHTGQASVLITNDVATDSRYKQKIHVKGETCYKLSCWIKTENVGSEAKGANLSVDGLMDTSTDIKGSSADWNYVELYGLTNKDQQDFILTLGLGGYSSLNTGKAWFDDVSVEELDSVPVGINPIKLYPMAAAPEKPSPNYAFFIFLGVLFILTAVILIGILKGKGKGSPAMPAVKGLDRSQTSLLKIKLDQKDYIIIISMTVIYLVIALLNLGSMNEPVTSWTPSSQGESVTLDLGRETDMGRIYFYAGLGQARPGEGKYRVEYLDGTGKYSPLATIEKTSGNIFVWSYVVTPDIRARYLKLIVDEPFGTLNEIVFYERNSTVPVKELKLIEKNTVATDEGKLENLFDEQDKVDYMHTYLSGMIFDEIYHARTAYEFLNGMEIYEWTHPPLGKVIISIGIALFGMAPFGWRVMGTLFGAAMVPMMYLFGKKLFEKKFFAFCSAFLMMFDFMHFGLTRIATIDVFGTFFVILMYYFIADYFVNKSVNLGFKQSLKPLLLSGICFGLGAASKWIGLYAGGGLALLFFSVKYTEYQEYRRMSGKTRKKAAWFNDFIPLYMKRTFLYCVLFFVIIPSVIYFLSYMPGFLSGSYKDFSYILQNQAAMLKYHGKDVLNATHIFSSHWWQWPIMSKPLETYAGYDLPTGMSSTMTIFGNPAIWWLGILAVAASLWISVKKKDRKMTIVFVAIAFQYLPWTAVTRITFIYHFFSSVPFVILCIVYLIRELIEKYPKLKLVVYIYLILVMLLFIMYYPVLSGFPVSRDYVDHFLLWFKGKWTF